MFANIFSIRRFLSLFTNMYVNRLELSSFSKRSNFKHVFFEPRFEQLTSSLVIQSPRYLCSFKHVSSSQVTWNVNSNFLASDIQCFLKHQKTWCCTQLEFYDLYSSPILRRRTSSIFHDSLWDFMQVMQLLLAGGICS